MAGETFIKGYAVIFSIYDTSAWEPIACVTSSSLSESVNVDEKETKCDPGNIVKSAGSYSYEISGDGEYIDSAVDTGKQSHRELVTLMRAKTLVEWRMATGITVTDEEFGSGYITSCELTGEAGSDASFSFTISGTGAITGTDPHP
ncbi:MAG: hypothetical protein GY928_24635 [Colwellia sp.]|nr:hypothetical protein [Colwellia sp.]